MLLFGRGGGARDCLWGEHLLISNWLAGARRAIGRIGARAVGRTFGVHALGLLAKATHARAQAAILAAIKIA
jgi:hypothetical protein